jgi:hypothetical protein
MPLTTSTVMRTNSSSSLGLAVHATQEVRPILLVYHFKVLLVYHFKVLLTRISCFVGDWHGQDP